MKAVVFFFICSFFLPSYAAAEVLFFRSNELGMTIEKIEEFQRNDFTYVAEVREQENGFIKLLYKEGEQFKKWEVVEEEDRRLEYEYRLEKLDSIAGYRTDGRVGFIEYYGEEELTERHVYRYENGKLRYVAVENGEGEELYRNIYKRNSSGRLIKVVREYPDKNNFVSLYTFGGHGVAEEWHGTVEEGDMFRYRETRQPLSKEEWRGLTLTEEEDFDYDDGVLTMSVHKNYNTGVIERTWYNEEGQKKRALKKKGSAFLEENLFEYNEEGKLAVQYRRTPGIKEKWEYLYDDSGERIAELYYKSNRLVSKKEFVSEDETFEYLYRKGDAFIKIHYKNDEKVDEELLIDTPRDRLY